eukprot:10490283-Lingulodinium_polyedra.AAC.1
MPNAARCKPILARSARSWPSTSAQPGHVRLTIGALANGKQNQLQPDPPTVGTRNADNNNTTNLRTAQKSGATANAQ